MGLSKLINSFYPWLKLDTLNGFVLLAIGLFTLLVLIYSASFMKARKHLALYYTYIILTAFASAIAVLANNLLLLLIAWGFLGLTLYLLITMGENKPEAAAKKTFIIIGASDALMLLGIGIMYFLTGTFQMDGFTISLSSPDSKLAIAAYLCIAIACFAKAGAMPMHSWIPDCAESAPMPVVAYLPASLDKLLGIYLLSRASLNLFALNEAMRAFLMLVGAVTIIAAVMMALVQHNMKRLLGYHAVSQVGYMVLGIGTGVPVAIAGGIFHMLNHAIYKSCLFLTAGNVEYRAKTTELDKLGGLASLMPFTYGACLIASLSISGVPPFNGFVSKWMIYQGLIENFRLAGYGMRIVSILCLAAAMFGSGLTIASFMKLLHSVFLGPRLIESNKKSISEVPWPMWLPCVILAFVCVLFGVFAVQLPLKFFIFPAVFGVGFIGVWQAGLSTLLIIIALVIGVVIIKLKGITLSLRSDTAFTGSETHALSPKETVVSGTEFYNSIKELGILKGIYRKAEEGFFDIYEQGKKLVFGIGGFLQYLHNGVLPTYLVWALLGMMALFFIFRA